MVRNLKKAASVPYVAWLTSPDCLTSVPFNQSAAIALVNNIKPILEFQSTTAMLKNPPRSWAMNVRPGYDLFGEFEKVVRKVTSGAYKNEHQVSLFLLYSCM